MENPLSPAPSAPAIPSADAVSSVSAAPSVPAVRRRGQFSLAELLLLFIPAALGARFPVLLALLIPATVLYFAWRLMPAGRPYYCYRFLLPVAWGVSIWVSFHHPGDEYGLFGIGAMPASWMLVWGTIGEIKRAMPAIAMCGMISMFVAGWALDILRVRVWIWLPLVLLMCGTMVAQMISYYPSLARAIAKNGSLQSYFSASLNVSLYSITLLSFLLTPIWRAAIRWLWPARGVKETSRQR